MDTRDGRDGRDGSSEFHRWRTEFDRDREQYRSRIEERISRAESQVAVNDARITALEKKQGDFVTKADYAPLRYTFLITGTALVTGGVAWLFKLLQGVKV